MRSRHFTIRGGINTLILFLSALLAHFLACGTFVSPLRFCLEAIFVIALVFIGSHQELEGPRLGLISILTQAAVHAILGGMMMNTTQMLAWHTLFAVLSYLGIRFGENFWQQGIDYLLPRIPQKCSFNLLNRPQLGRISHNTSAFLQLWIDRSAHSLRAPPLLWS